MNGRFHAQKAGTTTITATVTQYNRTDEFTANVTVTGSAAEPTESAQPTTPTSNVVPSVQYETQTGSSITQKSSISSIGSEVVDLSKLTLRYQYSKAGDKAQNFWCDNAGLQLNVSPYYLNITASVKGTFHEGYLEITFDTTEKTGTGCASCVGYLVGTLASLVASEIFKYL